MVMTKKKLTDKQKLSFYKDKNRKANKIIKRHATKKKHTIYGARALNQIFPPVLDKPTEDWDIFSPTPKKSALRVEKKLDRAYGGNFFEVEPAKHKGTFKVRSIVTRRGIADFTKPDMKIPHTVIKGTRYIDIQFVKTHIKKTLKDKESAFRWEKDRESLQRIELYEKFLRNKKRRINMKKDFGSLEFFNKKFGNIKFKEVR